jgi:type I restriction enzyme R subunit
VELVKKVKNPSASSSYPKKINTDAKRALYDNLNNNEVLALAIDENVIEAKQDSWRGTKI